MTIRAHNDRTRRNKAHLRHDLVADTLLKNLQTLLAGKVTRLAVQAGRLDGRCGDNMVKNQKRARAIKNLSTGLRAQLVKSLDGQRRGGIMAHHVINFNDDGFALVNGSPQLVAKNLFG